MIAKHEFAKMNSEKEQPIILVDDECNLCNRSVNFLKRKGKEDMFKFVSLHSETGKQYLSQAGLDIDYRDSVVLIENNSVYVKSDAVFNIAAKFKAFRPSLFVLKFIPRKFSDFIYMLFSKHRHRLLKKSFK